MSSDRIMSWIVDSRNHIEKQGDLELNSCISVSILADYKEAPFRVFILKATENTEDIFKKVLEMDFPDHIRENGFYKIERRWVSATLLDLELLNAMAYAHGVLTNILKDAVNHIRRIQREEDVAIDSPVKCVDDRPLCMIDNPWERSTLFSIATGDLIEVSSTETSPISKEEIERHYQFSEKKYSLKPDLSFFELCEAFFERAKHVCTTDGGHVTIVLLFSSDGIGRIIGLKPETRSDKWVLWNNIASDVKKLNIDKVIAISEAWTAKYDPQFPNRHAVDSPERSEALVLNAISFQGEEYSIDSPIHRKGDHVILGKNRYYEDPCFGLFMPIQEVWKQRRLGDTFTPYKLNSKDACPCLSGNRYKSCCRDGVNSQIYNQATEYARAGKHRKAESAYRAWLTQYIIWYNEHTVPCLASSPNKAQKLLEIDRKALIEILTNLSASIYAQNKPSEAIELLNRHSKTMDVLEFKDAIEGLKNRIIIEANRHRADSDVKK